MSARSKPRIKRPVPQSALSCFALLAPSYYRPYYSY